MKKTRINDVKNVGDTSNRNKLDSVTRMADNPSEFAAGDDKEAGVSCPKKPEDKVKPFNNSEL